MLSAVGLTARVRHPEIVTRVTELQKHGCLRRRHEVDVEPAVRAAAHRGLHKNRRQLRINLLCERAAFFGDVHESKRVAVICDDLMCLPFVAIDAHDARKFLVLRLDLISLSANNCSDCRSTQKNFSKHTI